MPSTALVTGSSTGIGYETARALLADGWRVYATARDRDRDGLEDLADRGAEIAAMDLTDPEAIERVVARVRDEDGGVDCLVNNAGTASSGRSKTCRRACSSASSPSTASGRTG